MNRKQQRKFDGQLRARQWFMKLDVSERNKVVSSIINYWKDNGIYYAPAEIRPSMVFHEFYSDNYGDRTIIKAVTGYKG